MKKVAFPVCIITLFILLAACGNPNQRLDEYVFYGGPQFKLKVVRYYRNIPFDQLGEHAVVMCQSASTTRLPAADPQDAGWRMLGPLEARGSNNAQQAALGVKDDYEVLDDHTLIGKTQVFNISFDACGHFINWDPGRLPQAMINPLAKPDSCAPNGPADCRYFDFEGERKPRYEQIRVAGKGQVSFVASSPAFRGVELLRVRTRNNGAVWHVEAAGPDKVNCRQAREGTLGCKVNCRQAREGTLGCKVNCRQAREGELECVDRQALRPDTLRSLSMSLLENGMKGISLMDWLESVLPSGSMVIWPDTFSACSDRRCAEIRFNDSKGNSGTLSIAVDAASENSPGAISFHSAVYRSGDKSRTVSSLASLRENLAADTR